MGFCKPRQWRGHPQGRNNLGPLASVAVPSALNYSGPMQNTASNSAEAPVQLTAAHLQLLEHIADEDMREHVEGFSELCLQALRTLGRIHLPQDHFEDGAGAAQHRHEELAPYVFSAVMSVNTLLHYIMDTFPAPEEIEEAEDGGDDFDFEFDLADDAGSKAEDDFGDLAPSAPKAPMSQDEEISEAAHAYAAMLRSRMVGFGERLRTAELRTDDSWPILAEVDDNQHRLIKSVQGLLFGLLAVLDRDLNRSEILEDYRSVVGQSVLLRRALADLTLHVSRFNEALASVDPDTAVALIVGISEQLLRYCTTPAYAMLRADDKKVVLDFRRDLFTLRQRRNTEGEAQPLQIQRLRQTVEGFSKFLDSMQAVNHREVLVLHDRALLEQALADLDVIMGQLSTNPDAALETMTSLIRSLDGVYGRNPELDEALRAHTSAKAAQLSLSASVQTFLPLLQMTLATVG